MALEHRAICECGWEGDWTTSRFVAKGDSDVHKADCGGTVDVECEWGIEHAQHEVTLHGAEDD